MRRVIGISILDVLAVLVRMAGRLLSWLTAGRLAAALLGALVGMTWFWIVVLSDLRPIVRDVAVMTIADKMAGPDQPLKVCDVAFAAGRTDCDIYYSRSQALPPGTQWGLTTNSSYITDLVTYTTAYFDQEDIVRVPYVPLEIVFVPVPTERSFHFLGQTDCDTSVILNERMLFYSAWNDSGELRSTLTHELIHNQQGNFCNYPGPAPLSPEQVQEYLDNASVWVEQHTESATLEVLAAECQSGDDIGCHAFWQVIQIMSRGSLYIELERNGLGRLYMPIVDVLTRNGKERARAHKSMRDWADNMPELQAIFKKYQYGPWLNYVLPAVRFGVPLDTGNPDFASTRWLPYFPILEMKFDDTVEMLGPLNIIIRILS